MVFSRIFGYDPIRRETLDEVAPISQQPWSLNPAALTVAARFLSITLRFVGNWIGQGVWEAPQGPQLL